MKVKSNNIDNEKIGATIQIVHLQFQYRRRALLMHDTNTTNPALISLMLVYPFCYSKFLGTCTSLGKNMSCLIAKYSTRCHQGHLDGGQNVPMSISLHAIIVLATPAKNH